MTGYDEPILDDLSYNSDTLNAELFVSAKSTGPLS